MKVLLTFLTLVLAAMAIPNTAAGSPVECTFGPMTPGGDTDCRAWVEGCEAHVHLYDVEDALNQYEASCYDCGVHVGGGGFVECPPVQAEPAPLVSLAAPEPIQTHCWTAEDGSGCSTTVLGTCTYHSGTMGGTPLVGVACWTSTTGWCDVTVSPVQVLPLWCDGPRMASADIGAPQPCTAGFAQTWCDVSAGPCDARAVPWTAWGDHYVVADCSQGITRCHVEAHTQDPLAPEQWCAF
jgi:hypothetical protein